MSRRKCCCGGPAPLCTCPYCSGDTPSSLILQIAGVANALCGSCTDLNGIYCLVLRVCTQYFPAMGVSALDAVYAGQPACAFDYQFSVAQESNCAMWDAGFPVTIQIDVGQGTDGTYAMIGSFVIEGEVSVVFWKIFASKPSCIADGLALNDGVVSYPVIFPANACDFSAATFTLVNLPAGYDFSPCDFDPVDFH